MIEYFGMFKFVLEFVFLILIMNGILVCGMIFKFYIVVNGLIGFIGLVVLNSLKVEFAAST